MRGERREKVRRRRRLHGTTCEKGQERWQKLSVVNEMAEQKTDRSDLTAVTWLCRFAASLAAFAALVWFDFTLLFFGGIFRSPREALGHLVSPEWPHTQSQHTSG